MSTFILRPDQQKLEEEIFQAWNEKYRYVLAVAPTGFGKTVVISDIYSGLNYPSCAIAHRQELVSQLSCALAANGIYHSIIASQSVIRFCIQRHIEEYGQNFHHPSAPSAVSSVQTIIRRADKLKNWLPKVQLWTIDEAHHVIPDNSWGKAVGMFPNAYGLGMTATPRRCDRKPLSRSFHRMVVGPTVRELIDMGNLADYRLIAPTNSIKTEDVKISTSTKEFNPDALRKAAHKSTITGDIVDSYLKFAAGMRGITFTVDVEQAIETAARYNAAGVPAEAISAKTPDIVRQNAIRKFRNNELKQLVNVDLFGEGFDVPAVEVVSKGRPTMSEGLDSQQSGRCLRTAPGKTHGLIIDHVANWKRHGLPDSPKFWSLEDTGTKRGQTDRSIPVKVCLECFAVFYAFEKNCPDCGWEPVPASKSRPEHVDGDLIEFSPELLAELRGDIDRVLSGQPAVPLGATPIIAKSLHNKWADRQNALIELRDCINLWAGIQTKVYDRSESQSYRLFYHRFGVDVLSAQAMKRPDMEKLTELIRSDFE